MAYFLGRDDDGMGLVTEQAVFFADRGVTEADLIERHGLYRLRSRLSVIAADDNHSLL